MWQKRATKAHSYLISHRRLWDAHKITSHTTHIMYKNVHSALTFTPLSPHTHAHNISSTNVLPPVTVSSVKALNLQFPTWFSMHCTWPWCISSKIAVSCVSERVVSFLRRRLCIVKNRPVQAKRRRGCSSLSSAIKASINGRSLSESEIRIRCGNDEFAIKWIKYHSVSDIH